MHFADKITEKTRETGSPLCLGLDPHKNLIPDLFKKKSSQLHLSDIEDFLLEIINLAKGKVAALKPQVAFFEEWGPEGLSLLSKISRFKLLRTILLPNFFCKFLIFILGFIFEKKAM